MTPPSKRNQIMLLSFGLVGVIIIALVFIPVTQKENKPLLLQNTNTNKNITIIRGSPGVITSSWIENNNNLIMCKLTIIPYHKIYGVERCEDGQFIHVTSTVSVKNDRIVMGYKAMLMEMSQ